MRKIFSVAAALLLATANATAWAAPSKPPANAPPTVSITSPVGGTTFIPPATITIAANAADSNGTVAKVDFYRGATLLGTRTAAPYSFTWTGVAAGVYSLTAKATDNAGAAATSAAVSVTVAAAQISVSSPLNGTNTTEPSTTVAGTFAGAAATSRVWVSNGNTSKLADINVSTNSFSTWMPVLPGVNTITVSVIRADKTSSTSTVSVNGLLAPVLAILEPEQRTFPGPANITFAVDAQSPTGTISKVDFINTATGGTLRTLTAPPYQFTWSGVANGTYAVDARASDNQGMSSSVSIPFTVVTAGAPTVSITSPSHNTSYDAPAEVTITAAAGTGDGKPATVAFYHDNVQFAATNVAPYSATWSNVAAGSYSLTATATDSFGATTRSAPVAITVTKTASGSDFVQMTSPANGATFETPAAINLTSNAPPNSLGVTYYRTDTGINQEIGSATAAPYSFTWSMRTPGAYKVVAEAYVKVDGVNEPFTFTSDPITVVVKARAETITYLHNDFLGSPVAATDANGALIWREDYTPYGERTQNSADASTNRQFYTGKPLDKETGLSYMNARYYDPHAGRFMAMDPVGFDETNAHSFNRYSYASNNPYKYIDPDGRAVESVTMDNNNNVHIVVGMSYKGSVSPKEASAFNSAIVKAFSGRKGAYAVNLTIIPSDKAQLGNYVTVVKGSRQSESSGVGARETTLYSHDPAGAGHGA